MTEVDDGNVKTLDVPYTVPYTRFTMPPGNSNPPKVEDFTALRVLFLDIDGVINSHRTLVGLGKIPHPSHKKDPVSGKPKIEIVSKESFDPVGIELINKLCRATNSHIVLSSSWRIGLTAKLVQDMLMDIGIDKEYVIGRTHSDNVVRGQQCKDFLDSIQAGPAGIKYLIDTHALLPEFSGLDKVKVVNYAIVDDDSDMLEEQRTNFVHVNGVEGFCLSDAIYAGRILSGSKDFGLRNLTRITELN